MRHHRPLPSARPLPAAVAAIVLAVVGLANAQEPPLARLAPSDTIVAVGLTPQPFPEGELQDLLSQLDWSGARDAWEALARWAQETDSDLPILPGPWAPRGPGDDAASPLDELLAACPAAADGVRAAGDDAVRDALLTVSMDAFAPFPAGLLAMRARDGAAAALSDAFDAVVDCFASDTAGSQEGVTLHVVGDGGDLPLVIAHHDGLFLAGTRPDVVRGALRRAAGPGEASFVDTPVGRAMAGYGPGLRLALHAAALARVVDTRVPAMGGAADVARDRAVLALRTLGGAAAHLGWDEDGIVSGFTLAVDPDGGDDDLAALLSCEGCRASAPFLAPEGAVAASAGPWRPQAWLSYLDDWIGALSAGEGAATDLRTVLREATGVDLDALILDWVGGEVQTFRLEPLSPDLRHLVRQPPTVTVLPVASADEARRGVRALADAVPSLLATMRDAGLDLPTPEDLDTLASVREQSADGVSYWRLRIGPTGDLAVGTVGSRLVLASPSAAFAEVVAVDRGERRNALGSAGWRAVQGAGDGDRLAWSYADVGEDLRGLAQLLELASQPLAFAAVAAMTASFESDSAASPPHPHGTDRFGNDLGLPQTVDVATATGLGAVDLESVREAGVLTVPGEVQGRLGPDTPPVDGEPMDLYRIEGLAAGDVVTVEMTSEPVDTYLYLFDADRGRVLAQNDDLPTTDRSGITFVADGETALAVGAASWGGWGEGAYTLRLLEGAMQDGVDGFGGGADDPLDVAAADRYASVAVEGSPRALTVPSDVQGRLTAGQDAAFLDGALVHLYRLEGLGEGDVVAVEMTSDPVDTYLTLIDADARATILEVDDSPHTDRSAMRFRADGETQLWIAAGSWGGYGEGPYQLSVALEGDRGGEGDGDLGREAGADDDGEARDVQDPDGAASGADPAAARAPSFDRVLSLFEVVPQALQTVAERTGRWVSVTRREGDVLRTIGRLAVDW